MTDCAADQWATILTHWRPFLSDLQNRVLAHLELLRGDPGGYAVDRIEHFLQTATRAFRDGRGDDYVVCALLHDLGDILSPYAHADFAALLLKPFVSEADQWMLAHQGVFQGHYFFDHIGLDRDAREAFRGHPRFEQTADFCHLYDQNSFDPDFDKMPLSAFEPMLRRVLSEPKAAT